MKKANWKVQLSLTLIGREMKCKPENTEKPGLCFLSCQKEADSVFITVCKTPVFIEGCVYCVLLVHHSVLLVTAYTVRDVPILPGGAEVMHPTQDLDTARCSNPGLAKTNL